MTNEFKVREIGLEEEKSVQQIEEQLLQQHEESQQEETIEQQEPEAEKVEVQEESIKDQDVLSYIKNRYQKEINSLDELFETRSQNEELPEDVSAFLKYKRDTGRGIEDFIKLNKDYSSMDQTQLLSEYMKQTNPELDEDEIKFEIESKYAFDEDYDDEKDIKRKKIAAKKELTKAREFFESQKDQYRIPLESSKSSVPTEEKEAYEAYKKYISESQSAQEEQRKRSEYFVQKTNEVFSEQFKGFEFNVGDKSVSYKPGTPEQLRAEQSDLSKFIRGFLDESGLIKDAASYHKSISAARNPDAFAKFFYEMGKAEAVQDIAKESKNIQMDIRQAPQSVSSSGFKISAVDNDSGSRLVIKSKK